jgi:hypothetical protein
VATHARRARPVAALAGRDDLERRERGDRTNGDGKSDQAQIMLADDAAHHV